MECTLVVPHGTNVGKIEMEYPDLHNDDIHEEGDRYFIGRPTEEGENEEDSEWMDHDEAIAFCGFCEGAIAEAEAVIDGNGGWAMGMLQRTDFSGHEDAPELERRSGIWHEAFERGKLFR
jgi:hypothetical protein